MVMKARSNVAIGRTVITKTNQPLIVQQRNSSVDILGGIVSSSGDYRSATHHEFYKSQEQKRIGVYSMWAPSGVYAETYSGVQPHTTTWPAFSYEDPSKWASLENMVQAKLYDQLRGEVDMSIDLLQYRQVRQMVDGRLSRSIAGLVQTFRRMRHAPSRVASNLWLEYVYGWKPMASTFVGLLSEASNPQDGVIKLRNKATLSGWPVHRQNGPLSAIANSESYKGYESYRTEYFTAWNPNNEALLTRLGRISSLNPASVAYELIPYSFVLDWFLDIGGYLRLCESAGLYKSSFLFGWKTRTARISTALFSRGIAFDAPFWYSIDVKANIENKIYRRTVVPGAPWPELPRFKMNLGASRILSGAALARQFVPHGWTHGRLK